MSNIENYYILCKICDLSTSKFALNLNVNCLKLRTTLYNLVKVNDLSHFLRVTTLIHCGYLVPKDEGRCYQLRGQMKTCVVSMKNGFTILAHSAGACVLGGNQVHTSIHTRGLAERQLHRRPFLAVDQTSQVISIPCFITGVKT